MECVLLADFGSTYTKISAVDIEKEEILGTALSFTTIHSDINEGLKNATKLLEKSIGKCDFKATYACSSAMGGLKMIAIGLVPEYTAYAAKMASLSAGAKLLKVYSYELNDIEINEIDDLSPDIILLTGGTDGGNKEVILHNANMLSHLKRNTPIIIAGNKSVSNQISDILSEREIYICDNVMPELSVLNIESARETIRNIFLERIIKAKGLTKIQELIDGILMPTPSAVLKSSELLSKGYKDEAGLGELLVIDIGGATTDIHSMNKGLPTNASVSLKGFEEPYAKRTVEGDLGMRYSASSLVDAIGIEEVCKISSLSEEKVKNCLKRIEENPELLAKDDDMKNMDYALASLAVKESVNRHAGTIETHYTPFGVCYRQSGKDLTDIKKIIGTGGPIINGINQMQVLQNVLYNEKEPQILKPKKPEFFIDKKYIMAAMGVLSQKYPMVALKILKKEIIKLS